MAQFRRTYQKFPPDYGRSAERLIFEGIEMIWQSHQLKTRTVFSFFGKLDQGRFNNSVIIRLFHDFIYCPPLPRFLVGEFLLLAQVLPGETHNDSDNFLCRK
jgi:hypothetical protein